MHEETNIMKDILLWALGILQLIILSIGGWLINGKTKAETDINSMKTDIALIKQDVVAKKNAMDKLAEKLDKIEALLINIQLKIGAKE